MQVDSKKIREKAGLLERSLGEYARVIFKEIKNWQPIFY